MRQIFPMVAGQALPQQFPMPTAGGLMADLTTVRILQRFAQSPYLELKQISCVMDDGVLVLLGSVSSFYLKQIAQEIARRIDGVETIVNQLQVHSEPIQA